MRKGNLAWIFARLFHFMRRGLKSHKLRKALTHGEFTTRIRLLQRIVETKSEQRINGHRLRKDAARLIVPSLHSLWLVISVPETDTPTITQLKFRYRIAVR
jgi:hypothetical protein